MPHNPAHNDVVASLNPLNAAARKYNPHGPQTSRKSSTPPKGNNPPLPSGVRKSDRNLTIFGKRTWVRGKVSSVMGRSFHITPCHFLEHQAWYIMSGNGVRSVQNQTHVLKKDDFVYYTAPNGEQQTHDCIYDDEPLEAVKVTIVGTVTGVGYTYIHLVPLDKNEMWFYKAYCSKLLCTDLRIGDVVTYEMRFWSLANYINDRNGRREFVEADEVKIDTAPVFITRKN